MLIMGTCFQIGGGERRVVSSSVRWFQQASTLIGYEGPSDTKWQKTISKREAMINLGINSTVALIMTGFVAMDSYVENARALIFKWCAI